MDIGATPVIFHRGIGDSPSTHVAIPVGTQHEVNAPGGEQEGEDTGLGAHGLVPVVIPLTLDGLVQIAGIQPGLGGLDPVHDLLIHNDGVRAGSNPGLGNAVAVGTEGVGVGSEGVVALGLQSGSGGLHGSPVLTQSADFGGVIGAESIQSDVTTVNQQTGAALPGGASLHAVLVGSGGLSEGVLVGQIHVGVNAQRGQRDGDISLSIGVLVDVVRLGQEKVDLAVGIGAALIQ